MTPDASPVGVSVRDCRAESRCFSDLDATALTCPSLSPCRMIAGLARLAPALRDCLAGLLLMSLPSRRSKPSGRTPSAPVILDERSASCGCGCPDPGQS